jgi:hypothetical protein
VLPLSNLKQLKDAPIDDRNLIEIELPRYQLQISKQRFSFFKTDSICRRQWQWISGFDIHLRFDRGEIDLSWVDWSWGLLSFPRRTAQTKQQPRLIAVYLDTKVLKRTSPETQIMQYHRMFRSVQVILSSRLINFQLFEKPSAWFAQNCSHKSLSEAIFLGSVS